MMCTSAEEHTPPEPQRIQDPEGGVPFSFVNIVLDMPGGERAAAIVRPDDGRMSMSLFAVPSHERVEIAG